MQTKRNRTVVALVALVALTLAAWSGSIVRGGFALDDREILFESPVVEGALPWTAAFDRDYWHHRGDAGHWRPTALLTLRADRALWGERARGYHATNVALHLLVVLLAWRLARDLVAELGGPLPWLGLALFAVHPVLADAVAWISGRTSMLCAAGGLAGALLVGRATRPFTAGAAAFAGVALALLGKEEGLVFAPLYVALGALRSRRAAAACGAGAAFAIGAWLVARGLALGSALPAAPHAPLAGAPLSERLAVGGAALLEGLRLAALPVDYAPTSTLASLAGPTLGLRGVLGWTVFAALAGVPLVALARRAPRVRVAPAVSAVLVAAAALPYLQLVPAGEVFAPRFLYLPLLLAVPLVDAVARRAVQWCAGRPLGPVAGIVLAALAVALAWQRAGVYAGRAAYREAVLRVRPDDAPSWNDLGLALEEQGDPDGAREAWRRSAALDATYGRPWSNLGRVAFAAGDLDAAREALERAVALGPANPVARVNLGSVCLRSGEPRAAALQFARATELAPGLAAAWRGLGQARLAAGDAAGAIEALELARGLAPDDDAVRVLLERARRERDRR